LTESLQLPFTVGNTRTALAVIAFDDPDAGDPVAVTQSPTATVVLTVWLNLVLFVYVTVVCEVLFWTCSTPGEAAAISPDAAGPRPAPRPAALACPPGGAVDAVADPVPDAEAPPQPASTSATTGSSTAEATARDGRRIGISRIIGGAPS